MGEAKRRQALISAQRSQLEDVVKKAGHALRRLAEAASSNLGSDCYAHAELGKVLLADQGFKFETRVGFAAWRIGSADGDVISHTPRVQGYLPPGAKGFAYHAWLESGDWLVDLTTYQLQRKAHDLDAADGGHTNVDWCPDYLLLTRADIKSYKEVATAPAAGVAYYEASPELASRMMTGYALDQEDVAAARLTYKNPNLIVVGPNSLPG